MITKEERLDFNSPHFDPDLALHEPDFVPPVKVLPLNRVELCRSLLPPTDPNYEPATPSSVKSEKDPREAIPQQLPASSPNNKGKRLSLSSQSKLVQSSPTDAGTSQRRDFLDHIASK